MKYYYLATTLMVLLLNSSLTAQIVGTIAQNVNIDDALIYDDAGNLYGSNFEGSTVYKMTPDGTVSPFVSGFDSPNGLAFDSAGNLYVVAHFDSQIFKVLPNGEKSVFAEYTRPSGIIKELDSDTMIVTSYTNNSLAKIAPDGTVHPFVSNNALNGPVGLAYDHHNQLYVANFDDKIIHKVMDNGELEHLVQLPGTWLGFIAYRDSFIYATILNSNRIYRVDLEGNFTLFAGNGGGHMDGDLSVARFSRPNGITLSPGGDSLVISDFQSKSIRYIDFSNVVGTQNLSNGTIADFSVSPNPAQDFTRVVFSLETTTRLTLDLVDVNGKTLKLLLQNEVFSEGQHDVPVNISNLPKGHYFLRLTPENGLVAGRKLIIR